MFRAMLRFGVVVSLVPVTEGQRRVTSDELAVRMQKPGIWKLDASRRPWQFIQFPTDDWHERHAAAEPLVAGDRYVVFGVN
jgi:hypothetical protein